MLFGSDSSGGACWWAQGVFFMHTTKLGLGVGVKWGRGWLLMRTALEPPKWSPPVFYKVQEGSIGFTAGETPLGPFSSPSIQW